MEPLLVLQIVLLRTSEVPKLSRLLLLVVLFWLGSGAYIIRSDVESH